MRFLIVAKLPEPLAGRVEEEIQRYDRWSKRHLPPHMTIIPPFDTVLPKQTINEIIQFRCELPISFHGWGFFNNPNDNVAFLHPGRKECERVRQEILTAIPSLNPFARSREPDAENDVPNYHITIAWKIPDADRSSRDSILLQAPLEGSCTISHLTMYRWNDGDNYWQEVAPDNL